MRFLLLFLSAFCFQVLVSGQGTSTRSADTTLAGHYTGKLQIDYQKNSATLKKYRFESELLPTPLDGKLQLSELQILGDVNPTGEVVWQFKHYTYHLLPDAIKRTTRTVDVDYQLNGLEHTFKLLFSGQVPIGEWSLTAREIEKGKPGRLEKKNALPFENGVAAGKFYFDEHSALLGDVSGKGMLNKEGFLHDTLVLWYPKDQLRIREERVYENGFLLELRQFNDEINVILELVTYKDVKEKLAELKSQVDGDFEMSKKGFGVLFDNGYQLFDIKRVVQHEGNLVLTHFLKSFDPWLAICCEEIELDFPLTRRFRFTYEEGEAEDLVYLTEGVVKLKSQTERYLNNPRVILRKNDSDSLAFAYAFVQRAAAKADTIAAHAQLLSSDFFDYIPRRSVYNNGIAGLNRPDTIIYGQNGSAKRAAFSLGVKVLSEYGMVKEMRRYFDSLNVRVNVITAQAESRMRAFEKQEQIDSLESVIAVLSIISDSLYAGMGQFTVDGKTDSRPLAYKIFQSYKLKVIDPQMQAYMNAENFEKKMIRSERLICSYNEVNNKDRFDEIERMPRIWVDSLFTTYTDNPFDYRKFENKIITSVSQAGVRLLRHYVNKLFQTNNCQEFAEVMQQINKLEEKMILLSTNFNSEEAAYLNRILRRETVPSRIERILEL